ncbi:cation:proton antiporter [Clostridium fallax]|uniref:Transporter, CPA2 family n=1 Tax=Clostridium fallax TaxID=1533 RepID=A0A1M4ZEX6_9CLOT|nr:cation:proton antiporter [Clostridium fallax]SHF16604.1 transporter, CPA2 family [Clostridium fallax]SQB22196.1 Na+/H+ antiporter [Clostridium fallax]
MENHINYDSLLILAILAFITPFIVAKLKKIKIPYQVGEIFIGILFGKSFLNLIKPDLWIIFLSDLGIAYLMFLSGLEIDFSDVHIKDKKDKSDSKLNLGLLMYILSFIVAALLSFTLKFIGIHKGTLFFTLLFTASAPGLIVPFLKQKHILTSNFGQTLLIYSLICEFICLIGLSFIASTSLYGLSYKNFLFLIVFGAAFLLYYVVKRFYSIENFSALAFKNLHLSVRGAFALILILVSISEKINTEIILGSFLAGIIFSLVVGKAKEEISHQLDTIGYGFLIPIFFIMVGVNLDLKTIFNNPSSLIKIPILLIMFFLVKLIPCLLLKKKFGQRNAIASSLILSAQLSLIIVGAQMALDLKFINEADYSAFILTTVISCILFPILFERIYKGDDSIKDSSIKEEKIIIREVIPTNDLYLGKTLEESKFPVGCRIFLIIRESQEIMPTANTVINSGDILVLAGRKDDVESTINLLTDHS